MSDIVLKYMTIKDVVLLWKYNYEKEFYLCFILLEINILFSSVCHLFSFRGYVARELKILKRRNLAICPGKAPLVL